MNTVNHAIQVMVQAGIPATATREDRDGYIEYVVRIPTDKPHSLAKPG